MYWHIKMSYMTFLDYAIFTKMDGDFWKRKYKIPTNVVFVFGCIAYNFYRFEATRFKSS